MLPKNTLLKTACHFLLLLIGFDTLTYRKDYDRSPILVGHHRTTSGAEATFCCERIERDPALANLIQYVMAQEHLTQQLMDYLHYLAILNPQITIGGPPWPNPEGRVLRLLPSLSPEEEECVPARGTFPQDPVDLTFRP